MQTKEPLRNHLPEDKDYSAAFGVAPTLWTEAMDLALDALSKIPFNGGAARAVISLKSCVHDCISAFVQEYIH
jgi:hypothetical protein